MLQLTRHYLLLAIAWCLLILGLLFLFSPIPAGIFFIVTGLSLLVYVSETVAHKILGYRQKHKGFNARLVWAEEKLDNRVKFISEAMHKTRPTDRD